MAGALVAILIEAYKKTLDFADSAVSKFDEKRYAEAVTEMYGREPTYDEYDAAIKAVLEDSSISTKEKTEMLMAISDQKDKRKDKEIEQKIKCAEKIDDSTMKKGDLVVKVATGVMTGGVSLLPEALNAVRGKGKKKIPDDSSIDQEID